MDAAVSEPARRVSRRRRLVRASESGRQACGPASRLQAEDRSGAGNDASHSAHPHIAHRDSGRRHRDVRKARPGRLEHRLLGSPELGRGERPLIDRLALGVTGNERDGRRARAVGRLDVDADAQAPRCDRARGEAAGVRKAEFRSVREARLATRSPLEARERRQPADGCEAREQREHSQAFQPLSPQKTLRQRRSSRVRQRSDPPLNRSSGAAIAALRRNARARPGASRDCAWPSQCHRHSRCTRLS